jgi:hypothetical protein
MGTLVLTFGSLLAVALWEACRPRRRCRFPAALRRVSNISFWLFNTTLAALVFTAPDELRAPWPLPGWLSLIAGFLLMDLMIYTVHRTYHAVPVLWRLHALHHSDPDIDWSSAVRHHPAEYVSAGAVYWLATLAIGIPGPAVVFHALCVFAMAVATHGNVRWPARLEHLLQPVIITLDLHLVHHSVDLADANANFGAVLSVWDRLFSTLKTLPREAISGLSFGVCELDPREACRPTQMLLTPLRIGKMYSSTYAMPDDRAIEISAERRGKTLRLRSRLTKDGRVEFAHLRSYQGDAIERAVADFTSELERITGLEALRLFPDNLWGQLR